MPIDDNIIIGIRLTYFLLLGEEMSAENSLYRDVMAMLFHQPVPVQELHRLSLDVSEFLIELRKEGADIIEKNDFLHWDTKTGFGKYSVSARLSIPVQFAQCCSSTNDWAKQEIGAHGGLEGVFVSLVQTKGRGRLGRVWESNEGGSLTCSIVCSPNVSMKDVACCSLVWMAEIAHRLELFVKWPNDLVSSTGKKIGGCLVELIDETPTLVFGLGVNVDDKDPIIDRASSLWLEGISCSRGELLEMVCEIVSSPMELSLDRWRRRALYMGQTIRVRDIEGVMTGIRDDGALLIGEHVIFTGDVELVEDRR